MMEKNIHRKGLAVVVICLFLLMSVSLVSSNKIQIINEKNAPPTDGIVELYIWGGFLFHFKVVNHNNESLPCKITIDMKNFLGMENSGTFYFTVDPNDEYSSCVDGFPMPFFHIEVLLSESGGTTLKRTGITLLGFNIFLTKEIIDEFDTLGEA